MDPKTECAQQRPICLKECVARRTNFLMDLPGQFRDAARPKPPWPPKARSSSRRSRAACSGDRNFFLWASSWSNNAARSAKFLSTKPGPSARCTPPSRLASPARGRPPGARVSGQPGSSDHYFLSTKKYEFMYNSGQDLIEARTWRPCLERTRCVLSPNRLRSGSPAHGQPPDALA